MRKWLRGCQQDSKSRAFEQDEVGLTQGREGQERTGTFVKCTGTAQGARRPAEFPPCISLRSKSRWSLTLPDNAMNDAAVSVAAMSIQSPYS